MLARLIYQGSHLLQGFNRSGEYSRNPSLLCLFVLPVETTIQAQIKEELCSLSLCLIVSRVGSLVSLTHFDCLLLLKEQLTKAPEFYVSVVLILVIFTLLVPFPILANRNHKEDPDISKLIFVFPEAHFTSGHPTSTLTCSSDGSTRSMSDTVPSSPMYSGMTSKHPTRLSKNQETRKAQN